MTVADLLACVHAMQSINTTDDPDNSTSDKDPDLDATPGNDFKAYATKVIDNLPTQSDPRRVMSKAMAAKLGNSELFTSDRDH